MDVINLKFTCGIVHEGNIYASCKNYNGLYRISCSTNKAEFISYFAEEEIGAFGLHRDVFRYHDLLCFVPSKAESVHLYHLKNGEMEQIPFRTKRQKGGFVGHLVNENLWLFPEVVGRNLYKINILTKKVVVYEWEYIKSIISRKLEPDLFAVRTALQDGYIFLPIAGTNLMLKLDCDSGEFVCHELALKKLWGCYTGSRGIWILADNGSSVYLWDFKTDKLEFIQKSSQDGSDGKIWNWIVEYKEKVYLIPRFGNAIELLEQNKIIKLLEIDTKAWEVAMRETPFFNPIITEKGVCLLPFASKVLVTIEDKNVLVEDGMALEEGVHPFYDYLTAACKEPGKEGERLGLDTFIRGVLQNNVQEREKINYGANIWEYLK